MVNTSLYCHTQGRHVYGDYFLEKITCWSRDIENLPLLDPYIMFNVKLLNIHLSYGCARN